MKKPKTEDPKPIDSNLERPPSPEETPVAEPSPGNDDALEIPAAVSGKELEELRAVAAKAEENWDRFLRLTAEFDNYRKRAAREKEESVRYANHRLLERLLPVLDSLDMALAAASSQNGQSPESLQEGINLVLQQFRSVLTEAGLEEIEAHGKPFDPNFHEAVSQMETGEFEEGHVAQQLRKGYVLRDRLVRPSTVIVAKKPSA